VQRYTIFIQFRENEIKKLELNVFFLEESEKDLE